jgi:hypothetical protein
MQVVGEPSNLSFSSQKMPLLLAGVKETASYLVVPRANGHYLPHGTPERLYQRIDDDPAAPCALPAPDELRWSDSPPTPGDLGQYALATEKIRAHFEQAGALTTVCRLQPMINIQEADACRQKPHPA